jgi:hypothetical protein
MGCLRRLNCDEGISMSDRDVLLWSNQKSQVCERLDRWILFRPGSCVEFAYRTTQTMSYGQEIEAHLHNFVDLSTFMNFPHECLNGGIGHLNTCRIFAHLAKDSRQHGDML